MARLFVEKQADFRSENLLPDFAENLAVTGLSQVRVVIRYDIQGFEGDISGLYPVLSEANIDHCTPHTWEEDADFIIGIRPLDGQYDARSAFAGECIKMYDTNLNPSVKTATFYLFSGSATPEEMKKLETYLVNPVESSLCLINEPVSFDNLDEIPTTVAEVEGFLQFNQEELRHYAQEQGFAMTLADLRLIQDYFVEVKRNPTITELKVIDTYWSDHCRHTTFMTELGKVEIQDEVLQAAYDDYMELRSTLGVKKPSCLMDLATIGAKYLKKQGKLDNLDESEEINACSIEIQVEGEPWLLMFKNETHNHPTEIEPFGGAATCLGGAIRDPLSGRSYVFGAMRVTGAADPRQPFSETLKGKLPQKIITTKAAHGYSSYGNQIGLTTGGVYELYHPDYVTKRMEVGAVLGACPKSHVVRQRPAAGDAILLLGGRTGRDGIGGATGSSKVQTTETTTKNASEVQKGNPIEERKIQRLFRNPKATILIKRCNDFGAGGVCVAIGELADSLTIDLDKVPKKYEGLDGTELAISESQERMAVVIAPSNVEAFMVYCDQENIEVTHVAEVTESGYLTMNWNGKAIFHVKRSFLDTNGATATTDAVVTAPNLDFFHGTAPSTKAQFLEELSSLNACSQQGLSEQFDSTIGTGTVLMPFGGTNRITPPDGMVLQLPKMTATEQNTVAYMTYGCIPELGIQSPFHAGVYSVLESVSKLVAMGADYRQTRLSNQEYFQRMVDETAFGKPVASLLGVLQGQIQLEIPSIGGKDSMSGSYGNLTVPPTMITFAVNHGQAKDVLSPELKKVGTSLYLLPVKQTEASVPDYTALKKDYTLIHEQIQKGNVLSAKTVTFGGVGVAVAKMAFGNGIAVEFAPDISLFGTNWASIVVEVHDGTPFHHGVYLGKTVAGDVCTLPNQETITLAELQSAFQAPLESVFPRKTATVGTVETLSYTGKPERKAMTSFPKPKVFIPVFPGTNCEYDTVHAFEKAGAVCETLVFRNGNANQIMETLEAYRKSIAEAQILMLAGGFSASDEPDGSAKFIATVLRNEGIAQEVMTLLQKREGLALGICNGFQALVKVGLLPYGEISSLKEGMPTLTFNEIGRHISCMSDTRVASCQSPWMAACQVGDIHSIAMSHGEGRFVAEASVLETMKAQGQIVTQYVDAQGNATLTSPMNPNGSVLAIEGITSPDGRILGKMGHSERYGANLYRNISGQLDQGIFQSGVNYFK